MSTGTTTRRSLFSRVPNANAPASNTEKDRKLVIDRRLIDKIQTAKLEPNLQQVLQKVGGTLSFQFNPLGGVSSFVTDAQGTLVAVKDDLDRISGMNTHLAASRKVAIKDTASAAFHRTLWAVRTLGLEKNLISQEEIPPEIPGAMIDIIRPLQAAMANLKSNSDGITAVTAEEGTLPGIVKTHCLVSITRIRNAVARFVILKLKDFKTERKLNDFLFEANVPIWTYARLTTAKFSTNQANFNIRTVYFPKDPSKGISFTFKETRSKDFRTKQGDLTKAMEMCFRFLDNTNLLKAFLNTNDIESDEIARSLEKVPIMIVPYLLPIEEVLSQAANNGLRGYSWSVGSSLTPKDNLRFLGTLYKRAFYLALPRPSFQRALLERAFVGFKYDPASRSNIFVQLADQFKNSSESGNWTMNYESIFSPRAFNRIEGRSTTLVFLKTLLVVQDSDEGLVSHLQNHCGLNHKGVDTGTFMTVSYSTTSISTMDDLWREIITRAADVNLEKDDVQTFLRTFRKDLHRSKTKDLQVGTIRSVLGPSAKALVQELKRLKQKTLANSLESWLRQFSTTAIQQAVAQLLLAKFDAVFRSNLEVGLADFSGIFDPGEAIHSFEEGVEDNPRDDDGIGTESEEDDGEDAEDPGVVES